MRSLKGTNLDEQTFFHFLLQSLTFAIPPLKPANGRVNQANVYQRAVYA